MKRWLLLLPLILAACVGGSYDIPMPVADAPNPPSIGKIEPTETPVINLANPRPVATGTTGPEYAQTQNAQQEEYLELQKTRVAQLVTADARGWAAQHMLETEQAEIRRTQAAAELGLVEAERERLETLTALEVTQTAMPDNAKMTADAHQAALQAADLAGRYAQQTNDSAARTQAATVSETSVARDGLRVAATLTIGAARETSGAPYTATLEAQDMQTKLESQRQGAKMLRSVGWGVVVIAGLGLSMWTLVVVIAKWNREAVQTQIDLGKSSLFRGANGEALAWDGHDYYPVGGQAPAEAPQANPVRPVPIYGVGARPAPQSAKPLNATEIRLLEILDKSDKLHPDNPRRIAGWRDTTGSADSWTAVMDALKMATVEIATTPAGTSLSGAGMTRDELRYQVETGVITLN